MQTTFDSVSKNQSYRNISTMNKDHMYKMFNTKLVIAKTKNTKCSKGRKQINLQ